MKQSEISFSKFMDNDYHEYWVLDGANRSFDLKEEIKSWGGYWIPEHRSWCIKTNKKDIAYKTLNAAGLKLQYRRNAK